jgi:hypothetical protein
MYGEEEMTANDLESTIVAFYRGKARNIYIRYYKKDGLKWSYGTLSGMVSDRLNNR